MDRTQEIAENIYNWKKKLGSADICAVTKTMPVSDINIALANGIKYIGENRVQELMGKLPDIDKGASVQLIGRLQTNKVKYLIGNVDRIQSVDRVELAREISRLSAKKGIVTDCLIEVSIAGEEQKGGVPLDGLFPLLGEIGTMPGISVSGLMCVMPAADDPQSLRPLFKKMRALFEEAGRLSVPNVRMETLSMGMTNDCLVAAECGSTMVRIGRGIFGSRTNLSEDRK